MPDTAIAGRVFVWSDPAPRPQMPVRNLDEELNPWVPPDPPRGRVLKATRSAQQERERSRHKRNRNAAKLATQAARSAHDLALIEAAKEALVAAEALPDCADCTARTEKGIRGRCTACRSWCLECTARKAKGDDGRCGRRHCRGPA